MCATSRLRVMEQHFISWAEKQLGDHCVVSKSVYGDQNMVYKLDIPRGSYFLKISLELANECKRLEWLGEKLPVPNVIGFTHIEDRDALLLSAIQGTNLAELSKEQEADKVIDTLVEALRRFHAVDIKNCPFGKAGLHNVLIHGDACLPNFICHDSRFSGYVDLGDVRVDNPEVDLSAAIWSLQYNLGPGYGIRFLEKYGVKDVTEELVESLRLQYEEAQRRWGL